MDKTRAILFDLDNTLVDFRQMKEEACRAAVKGMIAAGLKMNEDDAYTRLLTTYYDVGIESDSAFTKFLESIGQFDHKLLAVAINEYLTAKSDFTKPYPHVKSILRKLKLKGTTLAIVTDAPKTKAYQRLLSMGIESYFEFVVGFEDTKMLKETGLPLRRALQLLKKESPDLVNVNVLVVGDSVERDILPAKRLGLKTALCKYGQSINEQGTADYELLEIDDIAGII